MFKVLNLFRSLFWKNVTNPIILAVTGMRENRKSVFKSRMLVETCKNNAKKVNAANKGTVKTTMKIFLLPVRTARVLFRPFWSLFMSGASRFRLRKKP